MVVLFPLGIRCRLVVWRFWFCVVRSLSIRRCFSAGSFIVYKASRIRRTAQDGDKNLCCFAGEEVGFRQDAPAADGEEDREFIKTVLYLFCLKVFLYLLGFNH